jgi:hypothetical protein
VLVDPCLADCIEKLGDHADHPTPDQLAEVLPGVTERHGVGPTRLMLASAVAGEAPASAALVHILKHDDVLKLPPAPPPATPAPRAPKVEDPARAELRERRKARRQQEQAEARARREQSERDRRRA